MHLPYDYLCTIDKACRWHDRLDLTHCNRFEYPRNIIAFERMGTTDLRYRLDNCSILERKLRRTNYHCYIFLMVRLDTLAFGIIVCLVHLLYVLEYKGFNSNSQDVSCSRGLKFICSFRFSDFVRLTSGLDMLVVIQPPLFI